jgi:hypothetical protein
MKKLFIGLGIGALGAALTYLAEALPGLDLGTWTPVIYPIASTGVNALRLYLKSLGYLQAL